MGLSELRADARLVRERISKLSASQLDVKAELIDNVLPLFEGLCDAIQEGVETEVAELANAVDEMMDLAEDVLHPETSAQIVAVIEVGKLLANELEQLLPKLDDVGKKRVRAQVHAYRQGAEIVGDLITEITLIEDPEDPAAAATPEAAGETEGEVDEGEDEDGEDDLADVGEV